MTTDNIIKIGIDDKERLFIKPNKERFIKKTTTRSQFAN